MSTDESVTKDLMEIVQDGKEGFHSAAHKLESDDRADLASTFRRLGNQRGQFYHELQQLAAAYGDAVEESGSVAGTLHRGWLAVKDVFSPAQMPMGSSRRPSRVRTMPSRRTTRPSRRTSPPAYVRSSNASAPPCGRPTTKCGR